MTRSADIAKARRLQVLRSGTALTHPANIAFVLVLAGAGATALPLMVAQAEAQSLPHAEGGEGSDFDDLAGGDGIVAASGSSANIILQDSAEIIGGAGDGVGSGGAGLRLSGGGRVINAGIIQGGIVTGTGAVADIPVPSAAQEAEERREMCLM